MDDDEMREKTISPRREEIRAVRRFVVKAM